MTKLISLSNPRSATALCEAGFWRCLRSPAAILVTSCLGLSCLLDSAALHAADPAPAPRSAILRLNNGDYTSGALRKSESPQLWSWQNEHFTQPFQFRPEYISSVDFPLPPSLPKAEGEYCFELAGGDVLHGSLLGISESEVELSTKQFGPLHVRRDHVRRMYRSTGQDLIYSGPLGLTGWTETGVKGKSWQVEGGTPFTDQAEASIYGDFGMPPQAVIEFELSWKTKPDFILALGVDSGESSFQRAFCFEVWFKDVIVQREAEREADLAALRDVQPGAGRLHVQAYLDQVKGRILVYSPEGASLADLNVAPKKPLVHGGIRLTNKAGDVRLERLRISRWNGVPPMDVQANKARLHRTDGTIVYGDVVGYQADAKQFNFRDDKGENVVPEGHVSNIFLSPPGETPPRMMRATLLDGTQLSGEPKSIDDNQIVVSDPGIREPLPLSIPDLRTLIVMRKGDEPTENTPAGGRPGVLVLDGLRLHGKLMDGREQAGSSCLAWQPLYSQAASALRPNSSGQIIYREPPPAPRQAQQELRPQLQVRALGGAMPGGGMAGGEVTNRPNGTATGQTRSLHLRSGDTIPCQVTAINEEGLTFKSPTSDATFVKHEKVKAVELIPVGAPPKMLKSKRERFLTLPRSQRGSPPTHLVFSRNGDILRGRILEMTDQELRIEVQLEEKVVPRERITRIIWLHADELDEPKSPMNTPSADNSSAATRVQVVRNDGIRFTFSPEHVSGTTISGKSDVLGACRAEIHEIDQLLIGSNIEVSAAALPYQQWKLHHAIDPKFAQETAAADPNGRAPGIDSELVGKPAPPFELQLLDGKTFRLSDNKANVLVLDFWATWCGPCLQAMPQVESVVNEFKDRNVQLIAVNLEEAPQQIKSTLERHKLSVQVALDRDGIVAAKYQAVAIPQTVLIDRTGNVARVFVGGGPKFADQLRQSLEKMLSDMPAPAPATE